MFAINLLILTLFVCLCNEVYVGVVVNRRLLIYSYVLVNYDSELQIIRFFFLLLLILLLLLCSLLILASFVSHIWHLHSRMKRALGRFSSFVRAFKVLNFTNPIKKSDKFGYLLLFVGSLFSLWFNDEEANRLLLRKANEEQAK